MSDFPVSQSSKSAEIMAVIDRLNSMTVTDTDRAVAFGLGANVASGVADKAARTNMIVADSTASCLKLAESLGSNEAVAFIGTTLEVDSLMRLANANLVKNVTDRVGRTY